MSAEIGILIQAQEDANGVISSVIGSLGDLEKSSGSLLNKGLAPLQNMLMTGLKAAATAATAAIGGLVAGITTSVLKASDMQQGLADISSQMGATSEQTGQLKGLIQDLGLDPKLKVTATEAAQAIGQLGTAGLSVDQILGGAARSTVLLANATGADFASAANMATDVMGLWGIKADDLTKAVNGITATTIASKFTIQDYAYALAQGGGVAATVGVSFDDFNATIAAISPYFKAGADAGTSFKVFLQRLVPSSDKAQDAMRGVGLITRDWGAAAASLSKTLGHSVEPTVSGVSMAVAELGKKTGNTKIKLGEFMGAFESNQFFNANGQMKSMAEITGILNTAFKDLSDEQKNEALSTIFGTDAMRAAAAIAKKTTSDFQTLKDTMGKTDAEEAAAKRMDTFKGALEILGGVIETIELMIGDQFLPILTDLTKQFTNFLQGAAPQMIDWSKQFAARLGELIDQYMPTIINYFWTFIGAIGSLISSGIKLVDVIIDWARWFKSVSAPFVDLLASFFTFRDVLRVAAVVAATALAGIVASVTPVVAVFTGLMLTMATLRRIWDSNWLGIRQTLANTVSSITTYFAPLTNTFSKFGTAAISEIAAFVTNSNTNFTALKIVWDGVTFAAQKLFRDLVAFVSNNLPIWISRLAEWGSAMLDWIQPVITQVTSKLAAWGSALLGWIVANLPAWANKLAAWGTAAWQWIVDATAPMLARLGEWGNAIWNWVKTNAPTWGARLAEWGAAAGQWIVNSIPTVIAKLAEWGNAIWNWITSSTPGVSNKFAPWATAAWQWIVNSIPAVVAKLTEWGNSIFSWITATVPTLVQRFAPMGIAMFKWIGDNAPKAIDELTKWLDGMVMWSNNTGTTKTQEMLNKLGAAMLNALGKIGISLANLALTIAGDLLIKFAAGILNWAGLDVSVNQLHDHLLTLLNNLKTFLGQQAGLVGGVIAVALIPGLNSIAGTIATTVIPGVLKLATTFGGEILSSVIGLAGKFTGVLWPALTSLASTIWTTVIPAITGFLAPFAPVLLTVGAVALAVGALYLAWKTNFLGIQDLTNTVITAIKGFFAGLPATLSQLGSQFYESGKALVSSVSSGVSSAGSTLYEAGRTVVAKLGEGFGAARQFAADQLQNIMNDVQERGVAFAAGAFAGRMYEAARTAILNFGQGLLAGSPNLAGDLTRALEGMVNAFNWFMDPFKNHVYSSAADLGTRIVQGLAAMNPVAAIQNTLGGLVNGFNQVMDPIKNHFYSAAADLANRIAQGLGSVNMIATVQSALGGLVGAFNGFMDPLKNHVFASAADLASRVASGLASMNPGDVMRQGLQGIIDGFNGVMDGFKVHVFGVMQYIGQRISQGLADGIRGTIQAVIDALNWITAYAPQWVKDQLGIHSPSRVFAEMGQNIMQGLAQGISQMVNAPQQALASATAGLTDMAQGGNVTNTVNRNDQRSYTFNLPSSSNQDSGMIENVRVLNSLYNGV